MRAASRTTKREILALGVIATLCLSLRLFFALRATTMVMIPDEYIYSEIARSLAHEGSASIRGAPADFPALLYPISISPFWGLFDIGTAYRLTQVFNAICASLAVLPVYLLSRELGFRPSLRLGVPALAVAIPALMFVSFVMADALAYLLALGAIAAGTSALSKPGRRRELAFVALAGLAAFARIQYLFLLPVFLLAAMLLEPRRPLRSVGRFKLTLALVGAAVVLAVAIGLGSLLGYYHGALDYELHPLALARWIGIDAYVLVFAAGVLVVPGALVGLVLALARPRRVEERAFALLAALTAGFLLVQASLSATNGADRVQERYLILLLPLVAVAFGIAVEQSRRIWLPVTVVSAGLTIAVLVLPLSAYNVPSKIQNSPTLEATLQLEDWFGSGNAPLAVATVALILLALSIAVVARPRLMLPLGLALSFAFLLAGSAIAGHHFRDNTARIARKYLPREKNAIDRLGIDRLSLLRISPSSRVGVMELMLWNRSIRELAGLEETGPVDAYGFTAAGIDPSGRLLIAGKPPRRPLVVDLFGARGTISGGEKLLAARVFQVWRPNPELRFGFMVQGLFVDDWLSAQGAITVWPAASGRSRGVVYVELTAAEEKRATTISFAGSGRKYTIDLAEHEHREFKIPVDTRGRARLEFRADTAQTLPDGRLVSAHARIWFKREPTRANAVQVSGRYRSQ